MRFVLKICERIFGLKNFSHHEMFLAISQCRKTLVMSTPKPVLLWPKCFFYMCQEFRWISTLLNLFPVNYWIFSLFHFLWYPWSKVRIEGNVYKNLSNSHNCFSMLCRHENSCFCLIFIKINVKFYVIIEFYIMEPCYF